MIAPLNFLNSFIARDLLTLSLQKLAYLVKLLTYNFLYVLSFKPLRLHIYNLSDLSQFTNLLEYSVDLPQVLLANGLIVKAHGLHVLLQIVD